MMSTSLSCLAFETLYNKLSPSNKPVSLSTYLATNEESLEGFPDESPLFITWNKNDNLRGCIGTFSSLPIDVGIPRFSITSAFHDSRFPQIKRNELEQLSVSITLLDKFTPISDCEDWVIGDHGLKVAFNYNDECFSGTFLPVVAEEQGWDKLTTLYYLLKKSDFNSIPMKKVKEFYNDGISKGWLELERYDGLKSSLSYEEFNEIRSSI